MVPIILPGLIGVLPQTRKLIIFIIIWTKVGHIEGGRDSILSREVDVVSTRTNLLNDLKWTIRPWHKRGFTLARESFFPQMDPSQVSRLKLCILSMLVCMLLGLLIGFLNPFPHLGV